MPSAPSTQTKPSLTQKHLDELLAQKQEMTEKIDAFQKELKARVLPVEPAIKPVQFQDKLKDTVAQVAATLEKYGAMEYTLIVAATASDPAAMQFLAPYAGCAMGEWFMQQGRDALIVYDDLGAAAGQTIGYVEGREAASPFDEPTPIDAINAALVDEISYAPLTKGIPGKSGGLK